MKYDTLGLCYLVVLVLTIAKHCVPFVRFFAWSYHFPTTLLTQCTAMAHVWRTISYMMSNPIIFLNTCDPMERRPTWAVPAMSSAQLFHCGQRSLSWKVVSLDVQQQCSWLNQKPMRHTPSFRSVIQWAAMSIPPARAPVGQNAELRMEAICGWAHNIFSKLPFCCVLSRFKYMSILNCFPS